MLQRVAPDFLIEVACPYRKRNRAGCPCRKPNPAGN